MKNRAKCKLCKSIIESFHNHDYVMCKCGEIAVDGGNDYHKTFAKDYANFLRIDDEGNEVVVKVIEKDDKEIDVKPLDIPKPTKEELVKMLEEMSKRIEDLPPHAMSLPITHYDFGSLLSLLCLILRSDSSQ